MRRENYVIVERTGDIRSGMGRSSKTTSSTLRSTNDGLSDMGERGWRGDGGYSAEEAGGEGVFEVGGTEASDRAGKCLGRCI